MQEDNGGGFSLPQQMAVLPLERRCTPEGKRTPDSEHRGPLDGAFHSVMVHSNLEIRPLQTPVSAPPPPAGDAPVMSEIRSLVVAPVRGPSRQESFAPLFLAFRMKEVNGKKFCLMCFLSSSALRCPQKRIVTSGMYHLLDW